MSLIRKNKYIFSAVLILLLISVKPVQANSKIPLKKAIDWGLVHNQTLSSLNNNLEDIKTNIKKIKAKLNWQVDVSGDLAYGTIKNVAEYNNEIASQKFMLSGNKSYLNGFNFNSKLTFSNNELISNESLKEKINFNFNLNQRLYKFSTLI